MSMDEIDFDEFGVALKENIGPNQFFNFEPSKTPLYNMRNPKP
jgi:hypothetical protein